MEHLHQAGEGTLGKGAAKMRGMENETEIQLRLCRLTGSCDPPACGREGAACHWDGGVFEQR